MKLSLIILLLFSTISRTQNICPVPKDEYKAIFEIVFSSNHYESKKTILINNYYSSCAGSLLTINSNYLITSGQSLYNDKNLNYYEIISLNYSRKKISITTIYRSKSLFVTTNLIKKRGEWIIEDESIVQGRPKVSSFLYNTIKKNM